MVQSPNAVRLLMGGSILFYASSLFLPAFETTFATHNGWYALKNGWWALLAFNPAWLANPLYFVALLATRRNQKKRAQTAAGLALLFSLTSWFSPLGGYEQGSDIPIQRFLLGYYLWTLSLVVLLLATTLALRERGSALLKTESIDPD